MIDVNLLPQNDLVKKQDTKIKFYSVLVIVVTVLVVSATIGGLLIYKGMQEKQLAELMLREKTAKASLEQDTQKATTLISLKKKAKGIETIEKNRYDFQDAFGYVTSLVPPGIDINSVIIKDDGEVTLTLNSESVQEVVDYIGSISSDSNLKKTRVSRLGVGEDGKVGFILGGDYGESKKSTQLN